MSPNIKIKELKRLLQIHMHACIVLVVLLIVLFVLCVVSPLPQPSWDPISGIHACDLVDSFILRIGENPSEVVVFVTAVVPSVCSLLMLRFAITSMDRRTENDEWKGVEALIERIGPNVNLTALIAHVIGLVTGLTFLATHLHGYVTLTFISSMITILLTFANWYLTGVAFKHSEFSTSQKKFLLVEKNKHRCISWAIHNCACISSIWALWSVTIIGVVSLLS